MEKYKSEFIKFLVECDSLRFGEFKLKSGRVAPYFLNTGMFSDGEKIKRLGEYYAQAIKDHFGDDFDAVYGPAYKGIPLCVASSIGLGNLGINKGYVFNRKKVKDYGEKDNLVGFKVDEKSNLVLVDDVITSGAAIRESLEVLKNNGNPKVKGIIVSLDRQEKGKKDKNALKEVEEDLGIPIFSIVTLTEALEVLKGDLIDDKMMKAIENYRKEYGAL